MKKVYLTALLIIFSFVVKSQNKGGFSYKEYYRTSPLGARVDFSSLPDLPEAHIFTIHPLPGKLDETKQRKKFLDENRKTHVSHPALTKKASAVAPSIGRNFNGNVTQGTPNDNDFAISNGGMLVSVVNTNMNVYNDTGKYVGGKTLAVLGQALGSLNRTFDPRVVYDPDQDRFIVVFLQGSTSSDTRIIIAFSTSNDPTKTWNLYQLPGNFTGDSSWSDYPILSLSKEELFVTVNRVKDNTPWQSGFIESYIWQIDKMKGFAGDSLTQKVYTDIKFNDKTIWSICPVKGGSKLYGPEMYFLSQRPSDLTNDTVFVHYITNTIKSGKAAIGLKVCKNPVSYGLPPNAIQPNGKKLQTNDARVLSAMYEGGVIYYVGNTIDQTLFSPAVYFGRIHEVWTNSPRLEGTIISSDTLDFGYPSIAYIGSGENGDHGSLITFSHVSQTLFAGTSVVYIDRNFSVSDPVIVKKGEGNIQLLFDSVERWGDYTGIQRKYNELGVAWLNGSWGTIGNQNRTWISKVITNDPLSGIKPAEDAFAGKVLVYPVPAPEFVMFEFEVQRKQVYAIEITDMTGKTIQIGSDQAKPGLNQLRLDVAGLANGTYIVQLRSSDGKLFSHRFIVSH